MTDNRFESANTLRVKAVLLGERLDLRDFEKNRRLAANPLTVEAGAGGCAVLFRYGAVVFFGLSEDREKRFLELLMPLTTRPYETVHTEEIVLKADASADEGIDAGVAVLRSLSIERLQLVAEVLAKSVILDFYETSVDAGFGRIEPLAETLQRSGRPGPGSRALIRPIGDTLSIQGRMVARVQVTEKPELLWYYPEHERLYARLADEYELNERNLAIERKLDLISRTAATLPSLLQNRRSLRVEWYIVVLILVEILLTLYQMWP